MIDGFPGQLSNGGLISFGEFDNASYNLYQMFIFIFMAAFGGFSGAMFNALNARLTQYRVRKMRTMASKVMEVVACGIVVATMAFVMMRQVDDCRSQDVDVNSSPVRLFCQDGQASATASLCKFYTWLITIKLIKLILFCRV